MEPISRTDALGSLKSVNMLSMLNNLLSSMEYGGVADMRRKGIRLTKKALAHLEIRESKPFDIGWKVTKLAATIVCVAVKCADHDEESVLLGFRSQRTFCYRFAESTPSIKPDDCVRPVGFHNGLGCS
jgi:hypothetical protein